MNKIIIAIDGHSSCGKSTFAKLIAERYSYVFIDTGAMYRAVTLACLRAGLVGEGVFKHDAIVALVPSLAIRLINKGGDTLVMLNDEDVTGLIRSLNVSEHVSAISSIAEVREALVALQQLMGEQRGVVMDGRDIGTVVFPDAELKIFMTASVEVRAERRYTELSAKGDDVSMEAIKANLEARDYQDEHRDISPLRRADDALLLDNSYMTVEQQMLWVDEKVKERV